MNRRELIQTGLKCLAWAGAPITLAAAESKARIPIGFLGATYSHAAAKIKVVMASPDWEFVGVCDESAAGRQACEQLSAKLISQSELLDRARVVAVESDGRDHAPHAMLALGAGKHVHVEKPPATRLADMQTMVKLARDKRLLLQAGFMWRYHPGFEAIFEAVRQGWLGDVFMVRGFISNHLTAPRRAEWSEYPGGSMFELGSHLVDATVRLLGKPKTVTPFLRSDGKFNDSLKDNNVAVLQYERSTAVLVNTALQAGAAPPRAFEVLGTGGTASLQPIEPPTLSIEMVKAAGPYKKGSQRIVLPAYERYAGDFADLAGAVRGAHPLAVSLDDELAVAETVLQVGGML